MRRSVRWLVGVAAALVLVFGLLCLNYTKADGLAHHRQFAEQHGLPPPSETILLCGAIAIAAGAGLIGYVFGAGQRGAGA